MGPGCGRVKGVHGLILCCPQVAPGLKPMDFLHSLQGPEGSCAFRKNKGCGRQEQRPRLSH